MDWTIDTWVLYKAADVDYEAIYFLYGIVRERQFVVFDHDRHIVKEYEACLRKVRRGGKGGSITLEKWFKTIVAKFAVHFSGKMQKKHQEALTKLCFDRDDWPFVAVCSRSQSKRLVSEDSDYTGDVKYYLKSSMSVNVLSIHDALKE